MAHIDHNKVVVRSVEIVVFEVGGEINITAGPLRIRHQRGSRTRTYRNSFHLLAEQCAMS